MNILIPSPRLIWTAFALAVGALLPVQSRAQEVKPLPPDEKAYGLSLAEWGAAWCQWTISFPRATNPLNDKTGTLLALGQRMPVWFLPGPSDDMPSRILYVPAGASIMCALNTLVTYRRPGEMNEKRSRQALRDRKQTIDLSALEISVNGAVIPDLERYRVQTPVFTVVVLPGNVLDYTVTADNAERLAAIAEAYFVMLPPLPVGRHVISTRVEEVAADVTLKRNATFSVIVQEPNKPVE